MAASNHVPVVATGAFGLGGNRWGDLQLGDVASGKRDRAVSSDAVGGRVLGEGSNV